MATVWKSRLLLAMMVRGSWNTFKIAIMEDNDTVTGKLHGFLTRYATENNGAFDIAVFGDVVSFLDNYKSIYDMVLMDIEPPYVDGMEAAKRLRTLGRQVVLIFVTNVARYAVKGYKVGALDYLVKPIHYGDFELELRRAVLRHSGGQEAILVVHQNGSLRLKLQEIYYIEVKDHTLISHTKTDSIQDSGTLLETEEKLEGRGFLRCNKCYLIGQKHIAATQGYTLVMAGGEELQISRPHKKTFMNGLAEVLGGRYIL